MVRNYLSDRIKIVWFLPVLGLVVLIWALVFLSNTQSISIEGLEVAALAATIILSISGYVYVNTKYKNFYYEFGEEEMMIRSGIIAKKVNVIPYEKIQHIRTERTILEHLIGLVHIHVESAGSINSEDQPKIPGIPIDDHEDLIKNINSKRRYMRSNKNGESSENSDVSMRDLLYELKKINEKLEDSDRIRERPLLKGKEKAIKFPKYDRFERM